MKACTIWEKFGKLADGTEVWQPNHLSDGHEVGAHPAPKVLPAHAGWKTGKWRATHAYLTDEQVPKVVSI